MPMMHAVSRSIILAIAGAAIVLSGCKEQSQQTGQAGPPPAVSFVVADTQSVKLTTELPGRTAAFLDAEVRPQVSGILLARRFEEGQDVTEGDILYEIEPARYEAAFERAKAALAMAEAELPALKARAERYKNAIGERAVSQQAYDEAVAALDAAVATIEARKAEVKAAKIELSYTRITAPISGRIGKSLVTVGALVTANQPNPLATIRQFDPVYVDVMQSSTELLRLRRDVETGELLTNGAEQKAVQLRLEDGTQYALEGTLQFRDIAVDPTTGSFTLRIVFPNPDHILLPGMFVRAIVQEGVLQDAMLIPQQAVSRTPKGEPVVLIVNGDNVVEQRMLKLNRAIGDQWLVETGLETGDRIVVEGKMNIRPGATVTPAPFDSAKQKEQTASSKPASN